MEEESPRIAIIDAIPSAEEFISQIEPKNVPVVFHGCVNDWKAFSKWNPSNGGLDYLQGLAGSSTVEVMLSKSAPDVFLQSTEGHALCSSTEMLLPANFETGQDDPLVGDIRQIYLAQVPIMNVEKEERVQLESLIKDIQTPLFLETKTLASINLWMNGAQARSSTHYDPHHNLLCVVSGSKQALFRWMNLIFLFIQEQNTQKSMCRGFHQVDSESLTIAVNLWWRSEMMSGMSEHMDSYYLRRILKRLTDKEMNRMLGKTFPCASNKCSYEQSDDHGCSLGANSNIKVSVGNKLNDGNTLRDLEPSALRSLHELVSLVHDRVNAADLSNAVDSISDMEKTGPKKIVISELYHLEDDPVANIFWALEPHNLQKLVLAMVHHFPRTLEALVLHLISPVGAEVLTRKFDEMDQVTNEEERHLRMLWIDFWELKFNDQIHQWKKTFTEIGPSSGHKNADWYLQVEAFSLLQYTPTFTEIEKGKGIHLLTDGGGDGGGDGDEGDGDGDGGRRTATKGDERRRTETNGDERRRTETKGDEGRRRRWATKGDGDGGRRRR
ncbi:hypothetical protein Ccrd_009168 [Cynara cardunculus var. scolymus]|uniref:Cupin-like domain-containing protein n=1 Tax=Cynara cardunculus var. scolymus TaxID=59895 RepID=A0A103YNI9_CYNCS|nr:hypothetical protein Ccrd_009168 [Cynara cardunculus var. scolymus]